MPTFQVGTQPVQILSAGDTPGVIYNRSTTIQVFWGLTASNAARSEASILDLNATIAVDGTQDIWVVAASGSVIVDYMPSANAYFRALTAAFGALSIPAVFSPNFVHLISGWTINEDGSAEFNNLTIRGTFFGTDFIINSSGFYFYAAAPALGNLVISITNAGGTDLFGNVVPAAGFFMYQNGGNALLGLIFNTVVGSQPLLALFPDSSFGFAGHSPFIVSQASNKGLASEFLALAMGPGGSVTSPVMLQLLGLSPDGTTSIPRMRVFAGALYNLVCEIGTGGMLAANPNVANTVEAWHAMALINGWANQAAPNVQAKYRKVFSPPNSVEIIGSLNAAAATAITYFTLPAGYQPASTQPVGAVGSFNGAAALNNMISSQCDTSGNLTIQQRTATATGINVHGFISLDA